MGQEQSATRVMRLVVDDRLAANPALPAPQRDSIGGMSATTASVPRSNSSWSVLLNGSHVLALNGSVSFAGYSDLRGIVIRAAEVLSPSTSPAIQQLASGCFLFLQSHHLLDQKPISMLSEKSSNVYMTAVSTSRNSRRIHLTNPEAIWKFTCKLSESTTSPPCLQVPLLLSDLFTDVIQHLSKKLAETVDFQCAPMNFRPTSVRQCIESMDLHSTSADFEINVNAKENTINLVCLTCTSQNASSLSSTNQVATLSDERRFMELEAIATATSIDAAMQRFENMQSYASSGAEMLEKFNFDAIANSLRFISNVGEMIPFISCACKVLSMMTAYIDSLEETKNDMVQLKKHCRLLEEAINLKIKVFFDEDSRWIVDDETCLTCYKVSLNEAVDALSSAIKRVDTYSKEGLISKSMNRSKMDLKAEERKLDFALKSLTILDPFQLAFDMSQIEHFFQSADAKLFWKSSRFRDNVTTIKFIKELHRHCLKTNLSMQDEMPIIQAVDVNMDGYVHVEEFARVFNAETVGETVSLLLKSKITFDLGELREVCNPTDYAADAVDLLRDYISGTRDSLVNALDKEIQEVKIHSVFVLHATAGFGKSVIVAKLASLSNNSRRAPAVGFADSFSTAAETSRLMYLLYFFRHDDREIRTFDQFLKTLVYQMCCQLRSKEFQDKVEAILKQNQEDQMPKSITAEGAANDAENDETLLDAVVGKLSSMNNVVILIDACDECAVDSWQPLADFIKKLTSKREAGTLAHVARIVMTIRNDETSKQSKFNDFMKLINGTAGSKEKQIFEQGTQSDGGADLF
ncbi:hypothetical protein BJ741DRAFT_135232 [Chytriomyces cf. hyalinus JEL632]|nr:hypothetical protein BJ741DRAFT_135232 [Chytriomyces cf. hyalinus JEL632]